jgi:tRNA threonylcarbamoyladenosine biosynthesis protein TsaE
MATRTSNRIRKSTALAPVRERGGVVFDTPEAMRQWGKCFGQSLRFGDVLALIGPLGAGKTTLVQGIARGWGYRSKVLSPTFALANEYRSKRGFLFHMDMYRLSKDELTLFPLEDYLNQGICVIEWADRIRDRWPRGTIEIKMAYAGKNKRCLTLKQ